MVEKGPDEASQNGGDRQEQQGDIIVGCVAGAVGEDSDWFCEVEDVPANPWDQAVKRRDIDIEYIIYTGQDTIWVKENIEQEPRSKEAKKDALRVGPSDGLGRGLFHAAGIGCVYRQDRIFLPHGTACSCHKIRDRGGYG